MIVTSLRPAARLVAVLAAFALLAGCEDLEGFYHDNEPLITTLQTGHVKIIDRHF